MLPSLRPPRASLIVAAVTSIAILSAGIPPAAADLVPIQLDGWFGDWSAVAPVHTDAPGDGGTVDFGAVSAANDQDFLYIRFEVSGDVQPDEQQSMELYLDTDLNAATGTAFGGIGAELYWRFGLRSGVFRPAGTNYTVYHDNVGLQMGPTVSGHEFEIALRRNAVPAGGATLMPGGAVRFILRDATSGDRVPDAGSIGYTFAAGSDVAPTLPLGRAQPAHLRVATWNVQDDGLFSGGTAEAAQNRILDAIDPDVLLVCEVWDHSAAQVAAKVEQHLPGGPGEQWYAVGVDGGNVICSRFPILQTWEFNPGYRETAALLDLGPSADTDLLFVGCHLRCCTADADRQIEADAIVSFLRDAKTAGGAITLPQGTPFVVAGDMNLVGWRRQLETILTGDIVDQATWGADAAPDWDGGPFAVPPSRHPDGRAGYTWRSDSSTYYPGMLDWIFYTESALTLHNHYVLETRTMLPATATANGLVATDIPTASDHAPRVADFSLGNAATAVPGPGASAGRPRLHRSAPNPFNPRTTIRFDLAAAGSARLAVYDVAGRLVRVLVAGELPAGSHEAVWDGLDSNGRAMASGSYLARLEAAGATATARLSLVR